MKNQLTICITALIFSLASVALAENVVEHTGYLPQFESTQNNIKVLEESLSKTGQLAEVLKKGNDELSEAVKLYNQDRTSETKDRIYNLLGTLAGKTINQIDDITSNKDRMSDGLTQILYKMKNIKTSLQDKQETFKESLTATKSNADKLKDQLRSLAKQIHSTPDNQNLRRDFRITLYKLKAADKKYKTYLAHQRLNDKFAEQIDKAQKFFEYLQTNADTLVANLKEQKELLVMRIALLKDAAEMESWLRGESDSNVSAFAMMKKISELSSALEKFNSATDVLIEMNDIGTIIDSLPDASELLGMENLNGKDGQNIEDKYIDYFLNN